MKRMDVLDGASVSAGGLFSQPTGKGGILVGIGPTRRGTGWMVPVQDGDAECELSICVAVSMRRAFGGCLGTRRR